MRLVGAAAVAACLQGPQWPQWALPVRGAAALENFEMKNIFTKSAFLATPNGKKQMKLDMSLVAVSRLFFSAILMSLSETKKLRWSRLGRTRLRNDVAGYMRGRKKKAGGRVGLGEKKMRLGLFSLPSPTPASLGIGGLRGLSGHPPTVPYYRRKPLSVAWVALRVPPRSIPVFPTSPQGAGRYGSTANWGCLPAPARSNPSLVLTGDGLCGILAYG